MKLLIVESPSKAKTIEKYLGDGYTVRASVGHVRDLPKNQKKALDIENGFTPFYEISKGKEKVVSELKTLAKKADHILLATDPDREGEAIAWHIAEVLGLPAHTYERVTFNEITKDAVKEALAHPRAIDMNLKQAQEARRVLDRLFGYGLSGLIWKKVRYGLSAGRVQSPALRILVEREREINAFIPETYHVITAEVYTKEKTPLIFTCAETPADEAEARRIVTTAEKAVWTIADIKHTEQKRSPKAPFTTSTLQQAASSRLGFSPSRTMQVAQKLYEAGHITYMRTDSTTLSSQSLAQIATVVKKMYGEDLYAPRTYQTKAKNAQEAHEAIRPTDSTKTTAGITPEQKKLYELIRNRTIASQMQDARIERTKIVVTIPSIPDFSVTGSVIRFPGWLRADPEAKGEDTVLPECTTGDTLTVKEVQSIAKQTEPPNRYSEAGLVKELEARGIGRPSTYAAIISTLEQRGYIEKNGRSLKPTDTGEVVSNFLETHFPTYISDTFTAQMEDSLDAIASGDAPYTQTLAAFYSPFTQAVKEKDGIDKVTTIEAADSKYHCPKCAASMVVKLGKGGKFLSCSRYPECDGALTITGEEVAKEKPLGTDPQTGIEVLLLNGRFGPYVQLGEKTKQNPKPKRAGIPKTVDPKTVTLEQALVYMSLPRTLGVHPTTQKEIIANAGRFGPYIVHDGDFRSLKKDDVYTISLERALEILKEEKKARRGKIAK